MRDWLLADEADVIIERSRMLAHDVYASIVKGNTVLHPSLALRDLNHLKKAANFDKNALEKDRLEFTHLYHSVGILPPDQYMAVMLQLTEGCSFNQCTFCSFYKDQKFRVKTLEEFRSHALGVRDFLREGISLRKTIFLGSANALVLPLERLKPYLDIIHEVYDVEALGGIYAFLDGFSGEKKSVSDYQTLADMGVDTIYIGMESGSDKLLKFLNKPSSARNVLDTVESAKLAGIRVAVIVLLGAGGKDFEESHINDTADILNRMNLDAGDIIYFSKIIDTRNNAFILPGEISELPILKEDEQVAQWREIESRLKFDSTLGTPRISAYDIRDFIF